jgi:ATP-dependent helicase/nuclease subunit A
VRDFYAKMNSLRLFLAEPLGDFARRALEETGLLEAAAAAYHGQQTVSNLMKLVRRAAEANASRGETLAGFIRRLSSDVDEGVEEGESPLGEERVDAVRLLTVHKAKGLEYKVVFLPNLSAKVQGGARRPAAFRRDWFEGRAGHRLLSKKWPDLAMEFMEQDERKREEREAVRLFYVAATRAREHLILVGSEKASRGSFLELLRSAAVFSGGFMELKGGLRLPVTVAERTGAAASWPGEERDKKPRLTPALARTWAKRRRVFEETQGRPLYETPSGRAREEKPFVPSEGLPVAAGEAALVGKLCHAVMERWDFKKKEGLEGAIKTAVRRLAAESPGVAGEAVSREAGEILAAFLASPAARELAAGEILAREAPFLYGERGVVVRGVADILHRREGRLWVADYKTDRVGPEGAAVQAARYAVQGAAYREAVRRSLNEPCGFEVIFLRTGERIPIDKTPDRV